MIVTKKITVYFCSILKADLVKFYLLFLRIQEEIVINKTSRKKSQNGSKYVFWKKNYLVTHCHRLILKRIYICVWTTKTYSSIVKSVKTKLK